MNSEPTNFEKRLSETIREATTFTEAPDTEDLEDRAQTLFDLLLETHDRIKCGQKLGTSLSTIKAAIDAMPEKAKGAGATKQTLAALFNSPHWKGYRENAFGLDI